MAQTKKSAGASAKKSAGGSNARKSAGSTKGAGTAKKAAIPKLNERQTGILRSVRGAGPEGFLAANFNDQRTMDMLAKYKLVKRTGKKDPSGRYRYALTKGGEKHLGTLSGEQGQEGGGSPAASSTEAPQS